MYRRSINWLELSVGIAVDLLDSIRVANYLEGNCGCVSK